MKEKLVNGLIILIFLSGITYLVIKNWETIKGIFSGSGLKECKDLSAFECIKKHGAKKTTTAGAGDRYDYPDMSTGSYGFFANNRAVMIGISPDKKGSYDKKEIKWDDGSKTSMKDIFK